MFLDVSKYVQLFEKILNVPEVYESYKSDKQVIWMNLIHPKCVVISKIENYISKYRPSYGVLSAVYDVVLSVNQFVYCCFATNIQ